MKRPQCRNALRRILSMVVSLGLTASILPWAGTANAQTTIETIATSYKPAISESVDAGGFTHPGVGVTKDVLENLRTQLRAKKEPWNTYFNKMLLSSAASRTVVSSNKGADPTKPDIYAFNSQAFDQRFIADGLKAYTQAILYYVSGDEVYRANAMRIIRIWSQMDPAQYQCFADCHIHTGIPFNRMVAAAEILRYTSTQDPALQWTEQDTANFTANLITPVTETFMHRNWHFMNQHLYPLLGAMSGYIFTGNRDRYNEGVEWFTVNKTALDQGQNGSIKQLFRLVERNDLTGEAVDPPVVQLVEMGRDQAHPAGDLTNMGILARLLNSQGTRVDPVDGTASSAPSAVGPYEFLNDRLLAGAEFWASYMLGYDTPWVPTASHTDASGNPTVVYRKFALSDRGRTSPNTWELFYHYKYARGINMEQAAPNFSKIFDRRITYNWDGVDGGGDFWLFIPAAAESEGAEHLVLPVVEPYREIEDRFTAFDSNAAAMNDGTTSFVRINASHAGTRIALFGYANGAKEVAFRIRTNGPATMEAFADSITLPDTKGQWRYVAYPFNIYQRLGDLVYLTIKGASTTVDIDHVNVQSATLLTPPAFVTGNAETVLFTYAGATNTINYNFAATDANASEVVSYSIDNKPEGAQINASSGAFSWKPTQAGTYYFVIVASDGTAVTSKRVKVVVGHDRQSAVDAIIAPYNPNTIYTSPTLSNYSKVYAETVNLMPTASDDVFFQKMADMNIAVAGLRELTPLMSDGSVNYADMFFNSTFGTVTPSLLDGITDTSVNYTQAVNLAHIMDFGASYKISANAFQLQAVASFPERLGGVAMFGSDDRENWTRLTPGKTIVLDEMQALDVQDDLKDRRFRFLKMHMISPSSSMLQPSEFRIFGQRHETVNHLASVSIRSDQALRNRIVLGNTVKLVFQSTAPINSVSVTIQGQAATVTTADNLNWIAESVIAGDAATGPVKFRLNYKTAAGIDAEPTLFTTDASALSIADETRLISNLLEITTLKDSSNRAPADLLAVASVLFDGNLNSGTDFRVNNSGNGGWLMFDFRAGGQATLSKVEIIGTQGAFFSRINGAVVQGSNDSTSWTTISNAAVSTMDWQTLAIKGTQAYRYIRIYNPNSWFGNMVELRLHGVAESFNKIVSASIGSAQSLRNRVVFGDTVKLSFKAREAINKVTATIQGQAATVSTTDNINFAATASLHPGVAAGPVRFGISYALQNGQDGYPSSLTTDGSALNLVDESDLIQNVTGIATLIDSTANRSAALTLSNANALFDGNLATNSDFRIGSTNSGTGSYITFDFKAGNQAALSRVELISTQGSFFGRIKGTVIQGSNDNTTWATLTPAAASTMEWQNLAVSSAGPYRYIRLYNATTWFGNVAELRLHGFVRTAAKDVSASVQLIQNGATLNRATGKYVGSVTVSNTSGAALTGPLQLKLSALTAGLTLDNASGTDAGAPYVTLAGTLDAGATVKVPLTFSNPNRTVVGYTPVLYQGSF